MTKEQQDSIDKMTELWHQYYGMHIALTFLEKKLGKVNAITIEYRIQILREKEIELRLAQELVDSTGALNELIKRI